jgi:hypothetical protein
MVVPLRLLYLIFGHLLSWLALLGHTTSSKDIERGRSGCPRRERP